MDCLEIKKLVFEFYGIPDAVACGRRSMIYRRARYACVLVMRDLQNFEWRDISKAMQWGYASSGKNAYDRACEMRIKDKFFFKQLGLIDKLLTIE